jgi:putative membrane protein
MMWGWEWGGWMVLWMIVAWAAIAALIVLAVRALAAPPRRDVDDSAIRILDRRFAHGEIDDSEYQERRRVLAAGHR